MTKKFLAVTLVLVLAAGFAAVAQDMDKALTGEWTNTLTLSPTGGNALAGFDSTLDVTYTNGGISYNSISEFTLNGLVDQEFGVESTVGLLDLSSTINFWTGTILYDPLPGVVPPPAVAFQPGLDYWKNEASLTLGGVTITDTFLLQHVEKNVIIGAPFNPNTIPPVGFQGFTGHGSGMDLTFSGETPGGVSVDVSNYFGMEPLADLNNGGWADEGVFTGYDYHWNSIQEDSGYAIVTAGRNPNGNMVKNQYNPSEFQYVGTEIMLENQGLGCCDFSSKTVFSELNGFEYTEFSFTIESTNFPLSLDGDLRFTPQTKSIHLYPSLTTEWACFEVYTDLQANLANNSDTGDLISALEVEGFAIKDVELGHVKFSSYTALDTQSVADLNDDFRGTYTVDMVEDEQVVPHMETLDEVIRIEKLEKFPLDFTADVYFDMTQSNALFDLALFELDTSYALSDQFEFGTGLLVSPKRNTVNGLQEFTLSFDYSF